MVTRCKRKLVPRLSKQIQLSIQIVFYQIDGFLIHLLAVAVDEFDAVVVVGIMTCGNHNAAVKLIHTGNVGHGRRGGDVKKISIRTRGYQSSHKRVLKHIGAAAGILANHNSSRRRVIVLTLQFSIIPAKKPANLVCVIGGEIDSGFTAKAVCSKIFSHFAYSFS